MADFAALSQNVQSLLEGFTAWPVYYGDAPRDDAGVAIEQPFVVYTLDVRDPGDESGVFPCDLVLDVWGRGSVGDAFQQMSLLDSALDSMVYPLTSGLAVCDRNGRLFERGAKDPDDESIVRISGQYLLRFYPKQ